ncbi:CW domain-containing protein [Caenorhabditis elegans]|uniref:CW domain-containing protein n=1 Tax=Caenorhabditis elegans TaxID=6239 RepID=O62154_CAEEL|nr:CW domain-containing protein [Caenorhabditis elegans]CAB04097.2 CW domain-containing protein [Caenorhabditis elegans]|eukprot:NP_507661.2 C-type LECtin [Caenorhabditis elegans]
MIFLSSFFYFSVFLLPFTSCDVKMIKIFGKVTETTEPQAFNTVKDCIDECFEDSDCLLAFFNSVCSHYYVSDQSITVVETDRSEGSYVAFKTELPDATCPASYKEIKFSVTSTNGEIYSWKKTDNGWIYKNCNDGWTRYPKSDGTILCVKIKLEKVTQQVAKERCIEESAVLARVETSEECEWKHGFVENRSAKLVETVVLNSMGTDTDIFWINGRATGDINLDDCINQYDHYSQFISYETSAGNCVALFDSMYPFSLSDLPCDWEIGYMCEYVLQ